MVLLGKTGAGKSASGNTILGKKCFEEDCSPSSVTTDCSEEKRRLGEQDLVVVDTPGLFNTKCETKEMMKEVVRFLLSIVPRPDAFLWVIECGSFTAEVAKSVEIFKKVFESATEHTIVLFTNGEEEEVKAFIDSKPPLKAFIKECSGVYQVFDNRNKDDKQVLELVEKIKSMVKKNGKPYSNNLLDKAMIAIEELKNQPEAQKGMDVKDFALVCFEEFINRGVDYIDEQRPGVKEFLKILLEVGKNAAKNV